MVKCIYEGCGSKYHLQCLVPRVDEVRALTAVCRPLLMLLLVTRSRKWVSCAPCTCLSRSLLGMTCSTAVASCFSSELGSVLSREGTRVYEVQPQQMLRDGMAARAVSHAGGMLHGALRESAVKLLSAKDVPSSATWSDTLPSSCVFLLLTCRCLGLGRFWTTGNEKNRSFQSKPVNQRKEPPTRRREL